jgi:hypothetical protein
MKLIKKGNLYFKNFLFTFLCFSIVRSMNLRQEKFFDEDPEMNNSNRSPIINIHMEDHDSDPINFRRFDGERKNYSIKVKELNAQYDNEKKALRQVITFQQSKIANLMEIAESTNLLLDHLIPIDKVKNEKRSIEN